MWHLVFIMVVAVIVGAHNYEIVKNLESKIDCDFDLDEYMRRNETVRACALVVSFCIFGLMLLAVESWI